MKVKVLITAIAFAMPFISTSASADDGIAQSICSYVASNGKNELRVVLTENRLRLRNIYDGVSCDGLPLIRHAIKHKADLAAEFMVKQLPSSMVAKSGDIEWATSNGYADSPVIAMIQARAQG